MNRPDADETLTHLGGTAARLPDAEAARLHAACRGLAPDAILDLLRADLEARWRGGSRVGAEAYLELPAVRAAGEELALDLVFAEVVVREGQGEAVSADALASRFPPLADRLRRLLDIDRALGLGSPPPANEPPAGVACIGRFPILARLDEGGQAVVYRAAHPTLAREVVIKWSKTAVGAGPAADRLRAEGRVLADLDHPHLARVYDLDLHDGRPFLVMESVPGPNLEQATGRAPIDPRRAAAIVARLADAAAAAHRRGVLHLDIKPRNVILDEHDRPRLIDFGLARVRSGLVDERPEPGSVSGTFAYMAPEQARAEHDQVGPAADVFGLGGVLYFLLTGQPPYRGATLDEVYHRARRGTWDRAALDAVPRPLRSLCAKALAANPADRFPRAEDLARELDRLARGPTRRRWLVAVAAVVLLVPILAWVILRPGPPAGPPRPTTMQMQVWRADRGPFELPNVAPLVTGDGVRILANPPPDLHVGLFHLSEGRWHLLAERTAGEDRELRFPDREGQAAPLEGRPGTELLLVWGARRGPVTAAALTERLGAPALPPLPGATVLRLDAAGVHVVQRGRGAFGPARDLPDAEAQALRLLDDLRAKLQGADALAGIVFVHEAAAEIE